MATRPPNNPTQTPTARPPGPNSVARNPSISTAKSAMSNGAPAKRKADDGDAGPPPKAVKTEATCAPSRYQLSSKPPAGINGKPSAPASTTTVPYRSTARGDGAPSTTKPAAKPATKPGSALPAKPPPTAASASASTTAAPKKGFAATLARAQQIHQAQAAAAVNTIKHTPREKPPKISRSRMQQQAMEKQQSAGKNGKAVNQVGKAKNSAPTAGKPGQQQKKVPTELGYKGTMRKAPAPINYKGTMRAVDATKPARAASPTDRFGGKAKNGGYADWSDLSDAEEPLEEDDYESESDMEGGFDEMENEEAMAARIARKEDQEALAEEERHRKEKSERKKKLEALSKQASGKKRF